MSNTFYEVVNKGGRFDMRNLTHVEASVSDPFFGRTWVPLKNMPKTEASHILLSQKELKNLKAEILSQGWKVRKQHGMR
jgi:hypothetical protein